jgi:hypothetical protein
MLANLWSMPFRRDYRVTKNSASVIAAWMSDRKTRLRRVCGITRLGAHIKARPRELLLEIVE